MQSTWQYSIQGNATEEVETHWAKAVSCSH